jgi:hypothetical protein
MLEDIGDVDTKPYAHGKKTPTPSFYPSLVRMPMASFLPFPYPDFHGEKTPSHFP